MEAPSTRYDNEDDDDRDEDMMSLSSLSSGDEKIVEEKKPLLPSPSNMGVHQYPPPSLHLSSGLYNDYSIRPGYPPNYPPPFYHPPPIDHQRFPPPTYWRTEGHDGIPYPPTSLFSQPPPGFPPLANMALHHLPRQLSQIGSSLAAVPLKAISGDTSEHEQIKPHALTIQ